LRRWLWGGAVILLAWLCCQGGRAGAALILRVWEPGALFGFCLPVPVGEEKLLFRSLFFAAGKVVAQVDLTPAGLLRTVLPVVDRVTALPVAVPPARAASPPAAPVESDEEKNQAPVLVALYNTHTGETYALTDGVERVRGRGGVVRIAAVLEAGLRQRGLSVIRSEKIHDACYAASYLESEKTVREVIYAHPEVAALFDIHRDVKQPRAAATVKIGGRDVATVLIVVGSDARQPFPRWRQNLAFAQKVAACADKLYPGLCRGVRVKEGRYNQFLHPRALLLEVGGVNNTREEAEAAAELFAGVLAGALREERDREIKNGVPKGERIKFPDGG